MAAGAKIDQLLRDLYKSLLKQCEDFERAHEDARSSLGSADAKEKLAKCKSVLGEKRGKSQGVGEAVTVEAKYNELTSEVNFADDLEPAQIKQWREMTKAKKKEIGEYRDQLNKLEMDMMKEVEVRHAVGPTNDDLARVIVNTQRDATGVLDGALSDAYEANAGLEDIQEKLALNAESLNKIISDTGSLDTELALAGNRIRAIGKRIGTDRLLLGTIICCGFMVGCAIVGVLILFVVNLVNSTGLDSVLNLGDVTGSAPTAPSTRRLRY